MPQPLLYFRFYNLHPFLPFLLLLLHQLSVLHFTNESCYFLSFPCSLYLPLHITPANIPFFLRLPPTDTGHGPLPQLTGNVSEVLVSSLLQSCYLSSQTLPRVYQHYGPSPIQPLSTEMQILLTVYYLVQLGQFKTIMIRL